MSLAFLWLFALSQAIHHVTAGPVVTAAPFFSPRRPRDRLGELKRRDSTTLELSTCGYLDGDVNSPRTAQTGYDCRVDTAHGIWGFCPTTVIVATDCGLAAACKDSGTCSSICRFNVDTALTTFTCTRSGTITNYCSTALLTYGVDQTYGYLACGALPETQHYAISATVTPSTLTTASSSTKTSSASSGSTYSRTSSSVTFSTVPEATTGAGSSSSTGSSASNVGPIVGGVVGGLALVCASVVAGIYIVKRNRISSPSNRDPRNEPETPFVPPQPAENQGLYEVAANEEVKHAHASQQSYSYAVELPTD